MRNLIITILLVSSITHASGASPNQEIKIGVKGMVCAFCVQGIEKQFKAQPEVSEVEVSLEKKFVKLKFKEGKTLSKDKMSEILKDAGYEATYGE